MRTETITKMVPQTYKNLIGGSSYQGYMSHKGNCKYCKEKNGK